MVLSLLRLADVRKLHAGLFFSMIAFTSAWGQESEFRPLRAVKPNAVRVSEATGIKTRGYGPNRELLISGRVFDSSGRPAEDFQLRVDLRMGVGRHALKPTIRGHEYEVWVPIGGPDWFYLTFFVKSQDESQIASERIEVDKLRRRATKGFDLMLTRADRPVQVNVTHNSRPVAGAHVSWMWAGGIIRHSTTDSNGVTSLRVGDYDTLWALNARTDDFRLGGYAVADDPALDPAAGEFNVKLHDCRKLKIQFINAVDGAPVPGVGFALWGCTAPDIHLVATPDTLPQARLTTDAHGEAVYHWLPDWKQVSAYFDIEDPHWVLEGMNHQTLKPGDTLRVKLKPRTARKTLRGQVVSKDLDFGHLLVEAISFQNETTSSSEHHYVFTDEHGRFSVDCLPGATYCVFVNDPMCVSNMIDLIPFDPETGKTRFATLELSEGVPVEIRATAGPSHQLMRRKRINFSIPHTLSWMENGDERSGSAWKQWSLRTGYDGIARTRLLPGSELAIRIYENDWHAGKRVVVEKGEPTRIEIHRAVAGKREVTGQLVLPDGLEADLAGAVLEVGAVDGETEDRQTVKADEQGRFSFQTHAIDIGFFARTTDGKAAVVTHRKRVNEPVTLQLRPAVDLPGRLLGNDDQPLADHPVFASFHVEGQADVEIFQYATRFTVKTPETRTDSDGNYVLSGLPRNVELGLWTKPNDDPDQTIGIGELEVDVGETPNPRVSRLAKRETP